MEGAAAEDLVASLILAFNSDADSSPDYNFSALTTTFA